MANSPQSLPLEKFGLEGDPDRKALHGAFAGAKELPLRQSWLPQPERMFQPGTVRAAWCDRFLHVLARMEDEDIVIAGNPARKSHIQVGDIFQVFTDRPEKGDYLEIHITPDNRVSAYSWSPQLLEEFCNGDKSIDAILLDETPLPRGQTWIDEEEASWTAYLRIPLTLLHRKPPKNKEDAFHRLTFCRFDASLELETPVISSTSNFPYRPLFHQREFWHNCSLV